MENFDEIGDTLEKSGKDFWWGYNKFLKKTVKLILWEVSKSFDKILRKVWENFQPIYKILKFLEIFKETLCNFGKMLKSVRNFLKISRKFQRDYV